MRNETRLIFNRYLDRQAELNGVDVDAVHAGKKFTVEPSVQQKLNDKQQESSAFLKEINIVPVDEMKGDKLGLGVSGPLASRTDTTTTDRATQDPSTLDSTGYECVQTNSDTHITYSKLDTWAKFPDFQTRVSSQIMQRQALDRIMIGWNGASVAATSDPVANPLREDVNKGWLQQVRDYDTGSHVLEEGTVTAGVVKVGATGDYKSMDALVTDIIHNLLPSWARQDPNMIVLLGEDLLHDIFFPLVNQALVPTEYNAADLILSAKRVGGKRAATVPFMPATSLVVTRLDNLSIYEQAGKRRRTIVDNAKRDRIETYESSNDAYAVEDFDFICAAENIQFV